MTTVISACQNQIKQESTAADSTLFKDTTPEPEKDARPTTQVHFLNKVKADSELQETSDAIKRDMHVEAFNKYAADSLKNITGWEMIVTEINDNDLSMNSFSSVLGLAGPVYNLVLTSPIKVEASVDSLSIDNRVDFTYTLAKSPKGDVLKKQLEVIKTLSKGDVVIVSGAITHVNDQGKIDFSSFYDTYGPWKLDLLLNDISKSGSKDYQFLKKVGY
ncbi:hypothetical protein [Mucilaginibacter antarcticus]|uniref:hypothetical protein n=1 Tax=Mucilaginibacter antarcticus TaxID=1855725 RepID=UPI00363A14E2